MINILEPTFIGTNESVDFNEFIQENLPTPINKEVVVVLKFEGTNIYQAAQMNKNKADDLMKEGKYSRAVKLYTKALGSCPISDIIIYRRGLASYYSGDLEGALNDF